MLIAAVVLLIALDLFAGPVRGGGTHLVFALGLGAELYLQASRNQQVGSEAAGAPAVPPLRRLSPAVLTAALAAAVVVASAMFIDARDY